MITRGGDSWLFKHPGSIGSPQPIEVGDGDSAVAFDCGQLLGTYGPGQHTVGGSSVDLYFLRPIAVVKVGGPITSMDGPLRVFGEIEIEVTGPVELINNVVGIGSSSGDSAAAVEGYIRRQVSNALQDGLARGASDEAALSAAIAGVKPEIAPGVVLRRFIGLTVQGPKGNVSVKPGGAPSGPTPGTAVWAYWTDDNWYPATVREVGGDGVLIQWDQSGNTARLPIGHLKPR